MNGQIVVLNSSGNSTIELSTFNSTKTVLEELNVVRVLCDDKKDEYRFGFNGQMKTNEIGGMGNHLDFKFRGYDPRIGRFKSKDPLAAQYPWNSTYAFAENDVIRAIDLEGAERLVVTGVNATERTAQVQIVKHIEIARQNLPAHFNNVTTASLQPRFPNPQPLYVRALPANAWDGGTALQYITADQYRAGAGYQINVSYNITVGYVETSNARNFDDARQSGSGITNVWVNPAYTNWVEGQVAGGVQGGISVYLRPGVTNYSNTAEEVIAHEAGWHNMANMDDQRSPEGEYIYQPGVTLGSNRPGQMTASEDDTKRIINHTIQNNQVETQ